MNVKNPLTFYSFLVLILLNVVDYISAGFVLGAEANPLFLLTKSMWVVLGLKIFVLIAFGYFTIKNVYNTHFSYYLILIIMILSIGAVGIAAGGNVYAAFNPQVMQTASNMTTAEKVSGYSWYLGIIYLLPLGLSLLAFKMYEWSIKNVEFKSTK